MIIDIHSHILPGVDDGSPDVATSVKLVKDEIAEGVTDLFFTPHFRLDWFHLPPKDLRAEYEKFIKLLKEEGININTYLGQELHNFPQIPDMIKSGDAITLNGSKCAILEFSWQVEPVNAVELVKKYKSIGITPIIAHYERYPYKTKKVMQEMRKEGALFQINAYSLFGVENKENEAFGYMMIEEGYADFIAGDYHVNKQLRIKDAYNEVTARFGKQKAEELFCLNAKKYLF